VQGDPDYAELTTGRGLSGATAHARRPLTAQLQQLCTKGDLLLPALRPDDVPGELFDAECHSLHQPLDMCMSGKLIQTSLTLSGTQPQVSHLYIAT
jgi:hypothetical protein